MGSLNLVKPGKSNHISRFPPVFGSRNSKMLLVKSWDNMDLFWKIPDSLSSKSQERIFIVFFFLWLFLQNVTRDFFCNNSFDVKSMKFNLIDCTIVLISCFFQTGLIEVLNKKYFSSLIIHEKQYYFIIFLVQYTAIIFQKY